jgi:CspA family cold shock protein
MATGTVKWFDPARGFGYITPDLGELGSHAGEQDVFVAHTAIAGPLSDGFRTVATGARVRFSTRSGSRGLEAVAVAPLPPPSPTHDPPPGTA